MTAAAPAHPPAEQARRLLAASTEDAAPLATLASDLTKAQPKGFGLGTDRVRGPSETVARVLPLAAAAGITRMADVTGLDAVGIPVWCAMRPASKNLSVSQGKGATRDAARASAVMESLEMWHAEQHRLPTVQSSWHHLRQEAVSTIDVDHLERYSSPTGGPVPRLDPNVPIRWTAGLDLLSGTAVLVPYEVVHCDGSLPLHAGEGVFQRGSNGLASGNCRTEAVLHGLYEVIEREHQRQRVSSAAVDETCFFGVRAADPRRIDPATVADESLLEMLEAFDRAGVTVGMYDVTGSCGIPTVTVLTHVTAASAMALLNTVPYSYGSGAHLSRTIAMSRALTEAAQVRATIIAGSRDDVARPMYMDWLRESAAVTDLLTAPTTVDFTSLPNWSHDDLRIDLEHTLARTRAGGFGQVVVVDLSLGAAEVRRLLGDDITESPAKVVKVIVPGTRLEEEPGLPPPPMPAVPTAPPRPNGPVDATVLDAVAATGVAVFSGPTLPGDLGRDLLTAAWLPPAECGDVWRAVRAGARTVVLIDGRYASVPAPWHKEIHHAMSEGVRVIGAASMGALRAAEMHTLGVIPVGAVAEAFIRGDLEGDDEVAVVHGDESTGWLQVSDALVDVRHKLQAAVAAGLVDRVQAEAVVDATRAMFYAERKLVAAARSVLPPVTADALCRFAAGVPRIKQTDALAALRYAATLGTAGPHGAAPPFAATSAWGLIVRTEEHWPQR